ncbi:TadE/TadG family type IV pilus assembly protein [Paraburkholderia sp. J67]|uniref:TadE/TadG family type IV pilus assembly protein n=1 Tax=Paraburkholderia sp. J67 TaxID=2805435 RepID=UPI002ABE58B2|nr:TadE/TadG family type IV pilus assembly protein [Paraburkholderia sp. J67]
MSAATSSTVAAQRGHRSNGARRARSGQRGQQGKRGQRGSAIVEFALVMPMLLILLFGIVELGFVLYDKTVITSASRAAVRQGVAFGETATGTPYYMSPSTVTQIATGGLSTMLINFNSSNQPSVTLSSCTAASSCTTGAGCSAGNSLTVTVSYTFQGLLLGAALSPFPASFNNLLTLTSSTVMSCE